MRIPFGSLVDYLPTMSPAEAKRQKAWGQRTRVGLLVGWHLQPGCVWSGDYYVVDFEKLQQNPDAKPHECRIRRTSVVLWDPSNM